MTTLHDRLADLASDAPPGGPVPDLWDRGRRYHRQRRAGTAVIGAAALLLLLAVAGVGWRGTPHDIAPAGPGGQLRLPDRLYLPSRWLPGTDETGPIGPVVALVPGPRGSDGSGIAGVSTAGEYAFLDLPHRAGGDETGVAVSPDGRWVAYWLSGTTTGEPNLHAGGTRAVVGVGVYDTVTGDTQRYAVPTAHGLMASDLVWGGSTLWLDWLQYVNPGDDGYARSDLDATTGLAWDLETGARRTFTGREMPDVSGGTSDGDGTLVRVDRRQLTTATLDERGAEGSRFDRPVETSAFIDPTGGRVVVMADTDEPGVASNKAEPLVTAVPGGGGLTTERVPGKRVDALYGWRDDRHVVVQRYREDDGAYQSVDVETGETEHLVDLPAENWSPGTVVPQDVWRAPRFDAPRPPEPMSPHGRAALAGAAVAVVGLGVGALLWWRRRVRP